MSSDSVEWIYNRMYVRLSVVDICHRDPNRPTVLVYRIPSDFVVWLLSTELITSALLW